MARLEDVTRGAQVKGILPDGLVTVVGVQWHGSAVIELTYKDAAGHLGYELLFRDHEPTLEVLAPGRHIKIIAFPLIRHYRHVEQITVIFKAELSHQSLACFIGVNM